MSPVRVPAPRAAAYALAALAILAFANAADNGFALDDTFIIADNPRVHGFERIPQAITQPYWPGAPRRIGLYRPLTATTFAIEWELWGENPRPFHITNILLHALATVLVFALLLGIVGLPGALAGGALFAVHPVHVEAVANTVGRAELLAATMVLAATLLYRRVDPGRGRGRLWAAAAGVAALYFLGLASKEIAVTLPGLLLVVEAGRGGAASSSGGEIEDYARRVLARWPIYALTVVALGGYLALRAGALGAAVGNDEAPFFQPLGAWAQVLTAVSIWPEYLRLMVFPLDLAADYSPGVLVPAVGLGPGVLAGLLVGAVALLAVAVSWRRERAVGLGVLWFVVAVLPVSNLFIPIGVFLAERTLYLPSVGLALAAGGAVRWAWGREGWRRPVVAVTVVAVLLAGARTWLRTPTWKTTATVIETLARDHPESFRVQWLVADQLRTRGRPEEALARYAEAVRLMPTHYQLRLAHARALLDAGRHDHAIAGLRAARDAFPELPDAHVHLMAALLDAHRPDEAVGAGRRALRRHADHRGVHHQLAIALARAGDWRAALDARRLSLRLAGPRAHWRQHVHEAELLLRLGEPEAAAAALDAARGLAPGPADTPTPAALARAIETANTAVLPYP